MRVADVDQVEIEFIVVHVIVVRVILGLNSLSLLRRQTMIIITAKPTTGG